MMQLSDLLPDRLDQFDPNIQYKISSGKEFRELESKEYETYKKTGNIIRFSHQERFMRLMMDFETQLVIDEPGTGKTCLAASITEYLYEQSQRMWRNELPYDEKNCNFKKVIFLAKSDTLTKEFKNQIILKCTDRFKSENKAKSLNTKKNFRHWYETNTYIKFALGSEILTDEKIVEYYSDCVFIGDEIHNVIIEDNANANSADRDEDLKRQIRVYNGLQRIFDLAKRTKIVLLSATPMINTTREIMQIMNLILKDNKFPDNYDIDKKTINELEPYFRGQISFTSSLKSKAKSLEMTKDGKPSIFTVEGVKGKKIKIPCNLWISKMSKFQERVYRETIVNQKDFGKIGSEKLQSSIFVFPDGFYGTGFTSEEKSAMDKYKKQLKKITDKNKGVKEQIHLEPPKITQKRGGNRYLKLSDDLLRSYLGITSDFKDYFNKNYKDNYLDGVKKLGCKVYEVVKIILDSQEISFVYSDFKVSGVYCVAACLELFGYSRFNDDENTFLSIKNGIEYVKNNYPKKNRFAIFTQGSKKIETTFKLLNIRENRHGEYIKTFLSSRIGRDGINLSNVKQIHLLNPSWNESAMYQAKARGLRATSHDNLIEELKENENLIIKIYNHCALLEGKGYENGKDSVDYSRYQLAKNKDYHIKRIFRILKILSNGCQLSRKRNIIKGEDYSPECDYDKCDYECYGPIFDPETDIVNTVNYNLLYSSDKVENIIEQILEKYKYYNSFIFEEICGMVDSEPILVSLALEKIINDKISFTDRFGYISYLREDKGCFYTERTYPHGNEISNCSISYYTQGIIGVEMNSIDKLSIIKEENKIEIVENAILNKINNIELTEKEQEYLDKYGLLIYNIGKPRKELEDLEIREVNKSKVALPGVKSDKIKDIELSKEDYEEYMKKEYVNKDQYVHIVSSAENRMVDYAGNVAFEKEYSNMRLLDINDYKRKDIGWRDLTESEIIVYNKIISYINANTHTELENKFDFYGIKLPGKNFLIKDLRAKKNKSKYFKRDSGGTACRGYNKKELFELMWRMKIDLTKYVDKKYKKNPKYKLDTLKDITKDELYDEIIKKKSIVKNPNVGQHLEKSKIDDEPFINWSTERMLYYHNIFKLFGNKTSEKESIQFCNIIEQEMKERGQILS